MTWLLDGNLLVALRIDSHVHHERAHRWFRAIGRAKFATSVITQGTLLRLHMRSAADTSASAAWDALRETCADLKHVFWDDGFSYAAVPHHHLHGSAQITDAWLAELARRRKGKLATMDSSLVTVHADVAVLIPN